MKFLYVPWRSQYVKNKPKDDACVFCEKIASDDDANNFILGRYKHNAVFLNLFPYNAGHLMIIPYKHTNNLDELNKEEKSELIELVSQSIKILENHTKADGFNVGLNLGKAAGSGIPTHLHMHVLPRWEGDTNFLPTLSNTKTISFDLNKIYQDLKPHFNVLKI